MKAVRLIRPGCPLELHDVPVPAPGAQDVLVRVKAAGICHSDAHYRVGMSRVDPLPLILGRLDARRVITAGQCVDGLVEARNQGRRTQYIGVGALVQNPAFNFFQPAQTQPQVGAAAG
jgi:D-arabinose 1-dehydrogenase-like Zn-dependent alcohol dehydrogenase